MGVSGIYITKDSIQQTVNVSPINAGRCNNVTFYYDCTWQSRSYMMTLGWLVRDGCGDIHAFVSKNHVQHEDK